MHKKPKLLIPAIVVLFIFLASAAYYFLNLFTQSDRLVASGTVEATEIRLGTQLGGLVNQVAKKEGEKVQTGEMLIEIQPASGVSAGYTEKIRTPIDGVVLERAVEPGEVALQGSTLLVVGDLKSLTLTVYVPEDRYGQISLGQTYPVTVDSFPGRVFTGTVSHIADEAEFTPRNVQTVQGRKNTVYAIRLALDNTDLSLKPGMPADVQLE